MKHLLKQKSLDLFKKYLSHSDVKNTFNQSVTLCSQELGIRKNNNSPYYDYSIESSVTSQRDDIVFISGRFRSGSSVFWNVFRSQPDSTAYYEPFNERQWFNKNVRGSFVDGTHIGIDDYWKEYDHLGVLSQYYQEDWIRAQLHMDPDTVDINMMKFIDAMVENAPHRPVLQFNRIDFRLPWIAKHYPNAKILHIYRNPRDQWLSFLTDKETMNAVEVEHTYQDAFYLDVWCQDLETQFPFLNKKHTPHPYMRFYYLWKLSYLYGVKYSHYSVSLEHLSSQPHAALEEIKSELRWSNFDIEEGAKVIKPIVSDKWTTYASEAWFAEKERLCERQLFAFLPHS